MTDTGVKSVLPSGLISGLKRSLKSRLKEELGLGRKLLKLCEEESDVLIRNDVTRLSLLQEEQKRCLAELESLEQQRIATTRELAVGVGLAPNVTLLALTADMPDRELKTLRAQLLSVHQQLEAVQTRNRRLLDNALAYVRYSMELLTEIALRPARYGYNLNRISAPCFYLDSRV